MTQQHRLITYIIIVAIVVAIAWLGSSSQAYTPHGVFLPSSKQQFTQLTPEEVNLSGNNGSVTGTRIGTINIQSYAPNNDKKVIIAAERYAAQLAAAHGANHVVVTLIGIDPSAKTLTLQAKALHT